MIITAGLLTTSFFVSSWVIECTTGIVCIIMASGGGIYYYLNTADSNADPLAQNIQEASNHWLRLSTQTNTQTMALEQTFMETHASLITHAQEIEAKTIRYQAQLNAGETRLKNMMDELQASTNALSSARLQLEMDNNARIRLAHQLCSFFSATDQTPPSEPWSMLTRLKDTLSAWI